MKARTGRVERRPVGVTLLVLFFSFGAVVCSLVVAALLFPGGVLEPIWSLKPEARADFQRLGGWSITLMVTVGAASGLAALGLARYAEWGRRIALGVLVVNLLGDLLNAVLRSDLRTLIGLPIGGFMIAYLMSRRVQRWFT